MAEAIIPRRTINKQEYVLLADVTVGTATTSVDITGLNIGKEEEIVLLINMVGSSDSLFYIYSNANTTNGNYYVQTINANSTSISSGRANSPQCLYRSNGLTSVSFIKIKLTNNGYFTYQANSQLNIGSSMQINNYYGTSTFTMPSITRLTLTASATSAIGAGSRFQLYKVAQ